MDTRVFSAFNLARGVLLNSRLTLADSGNQPLKLLDIVVSGMGMDSTKGLWLTPLHAIPAVPRVFPFDLIYLDREYRVLETAEMGPGTEFPAFRPEVASALVLPSDVLRATHTAPGDRLIVCPATDLESLLDTSATESLRVANLAPHPVPAASTSSDPRSTRPIIELVPETPVPVLSPRIVPGFERSIPSASAKKEDQPGSTMSPGPSIDISEAVFERSNKVFAPIIEHRIDPEDLFSNWVVSPPSAPVVGSKPDSVLAKRPASAPSSAIRNGNSSKPIAEEGSAEAIESVQTAAAAPEPTTAQPKSKVASARSDRSAAKAKQNGEKPKQSAVSRSAAPFAQTVPATTFTAVPYGMWQVSMPTAVAPVSSKPAGSPKTSQGQSLTTSSNRQAKSPAVVSSSTTDAKQMSSVTPTAEANLESQIPPRATDSKAQAPKEFITQGPASLSEKEFRAAPKPVVTSPDAAQKHTPGDFVASLQEKLQRVQQSKPEPAMSVQNPPRPLKTADSPYGSTASELPDGIPAPSEPIVAKPNPKAPSKFSKPETSPATDRKDAAHSSPASQPRPEKANTEHSAGSFRARFKQWFNPVSNPSDRRRSGRRYVPGMVAHYFTGGAPKPKEVADISMSGMYLLTDDRWMPGTMIQMTLQKPCARGERKQSINVLSRIVRRGSDGVAAEFVMSETLSRVSHDIQPSQATDKFALARFL